MRAGKADSLTPLDQIIAQLERLGFPWFRISCREADWLGTIDRQELDTASPGSMVTVLRLDPLDDDAIIALLNSLELRSGTQEFIKEAGRRGLGAILRNPQTLKLLAGAVGQGSEWPNSRQETFDMACHKMATERNEVHRHRTERLPSEAIMDAAGYLCAMQLLAGIEGFSLSPIGDDPSYAQVDDLLETGSQPPHIDLERALTTTLFSRAGQQKASPVHRHIAEFLAGRFLAKQIENGLPVERVMALMTSPSDQRVVSVLRGLSAWLAVHNRKARPLLIKADPVGVGLYGDIEVLFPDEKVRLLESLAGFAGHGQLFGHERADDRGGSYIGSTAQAFRSLASADMIPAIRDLIAKPVVDTRDHRMAEFIVGVLSEADEPCLESLSILSPQLEAILRDPATPSHVKDLAWDAFTHIAPSGGNMERTLLELIREFQDGALPDSDGQLRGALLSYLYPSVLGPSEVWQVALPLNPHDIHYRMTWFLDHNLLRDSSNHQIAGLLDALHEDASNLIPSLSNARLDNRLFRMLARGLEGCGEDLELPRLYNWLSLIGDSLDGLRWEEDQLRRMQSWLEAHPEIQKSIFLDWLRQSAQDLPTELYPWVECNVLLKSTLPADFGRWCLKKAIELANAEPLVARHLLERSHHSLADPTIGDCLTLEDMRAGVRSHDALARRLEELCAPSPDSAELIELQQSWRKRLEERQEQERQEQAQRKADLHSQITELRQNRFFPQGLHHLANVYFGEVGRTSQDATPGQRISEFIGGDPEPDLIDAVLVALRGAVYRDDVPEAEETIALNLDSKFSWLALPVLASLDLLQKEDPTLLDELGDTLKRNALAIHYCVSPVLELDPNQPMPWFTRFLEHDHELVLEVLFQCARAAMRDGVQFPPGLSELDRIEHTHPILAHELTTRLLASFPVRARQTQIPLLDQLLERLLKAGKTELGALVQDKLPMRSMDVAQRLRWLATGTLLSPEQHLAPLEEYAGENQQRIRHLAGFLCNRLRSNRFASDPLVENLSPQAVAALIRLMGPVFEPFEVHGGGVGWVTPELDASTWIQDQISMLSSRASYDANRALRELINDSRLSRWRDRLRWAEERQRVLLRDAAYSHSSIRQVQRTLGGGLPANAADLAALLNDHLNDISRDIRGSSSNIWRQFWMDDRESEPREPKHEESCRDALLAILKERIPTPTDAAPEGHYVSEKRADIRVSYGGFNVPIEIKKDCHRDLWSALQEQLVEQYTTDPASSGHGIYLVLWTGGDKISRRPDGNRPTTPDELRELLEGDLTPEQAGRISVRVLDVTKP